MKLVDDARPVCCPVRRRSPKEEDLERATIEKLLRIGVVEHAMSPWDVCNVFFKKKDGNTRMKSYFRGLNALTVADSYPIEDVWTSSDWMGSKRVFSTFNLKYGFFLVALDEETSPRYVL